MPHLTQQISTLGPVLDLLVGPSVPRATALRRAGVAAPPQLSIRGLIDTGASGTCLDPTCVASLSLAPTGQVPIHTPSTAGKPEIYPQYDVSLVLLHPSLHVTLPTVAVISTHLVNLGIHALIGRDVLSRCLLVYDGSAGQFSLAF